MAEVWRQIHLRILVPRRWVLGQRPDFETLDESAKAQVRAGLLASLNDIHSDLPGFAQYDMLLKRLAPRAQRRVTGCTAEASRLLHQSERAAEKPEKVPNSAALASDEAATMYDLVALSGALPSPGAMLESDADNATLFFVVARKTRFNAPRGKRAWHGFATLLGQERSVRSVLKPGEMEFLFRDQALNRRLQARLDAIGLDAGLYAPEIERERGNVLFEALTEAGGARLRLGRLARELGADARAHNARRGGGYNARRGREQGHGRPCANARPGRMRLPTRSWCRRSCAAREGREKRDFCQCQSGGRCGRPAVAPRAVRRRRRKPVRLRLLAVLPAKTDGSGSDRLSSSRATAISPDSRHQERRPAAAFSRVAARRRRNCSAVSSSKRKSGADPRQPAARCTDAPPQAVANEEEDDDKTPARLRHVAAAILFLALAGGGVYYLMGCSAGAHQIIGGKRIREPRYFFRPLFSSAGPDWAWRASSTA